MEKEEHVFVLFDSFGRCRATNTIRYIDNVDVASMTSLDFIIVTFARLVNFNSRLVCIK